MEVWFPITTPWVPQARKADVSTFPFYSNPCTAHENLFESYVISQSRREEGH